MHGSRFRLERVRALREQREQQAKQQFAGALIRTSECEARLAGAAGIIARAQQNQRKPRSKLDGAALRDEQAYLERLERDQRRLTEELAQHQAELERQREAMTRASQDRQALERLKAKSIVAQQRLRDRNEQRLLDEIASSRHWRRAG